MGPFHNCKGPECDKLQGTIVHHVFVSILELIIQSLTSASCSGPPVQSMGMENPKPEPKPRPKPRGPTSKGTPRAQKQNLDK